MVHVPCAHCAPVCLIFALHFPYMLEVALLREHDAWMQAMAMHGVVMLASNMTVQRIPCSAYLVGEVLDVDVNGKRCCVRYLREKMATWLETTRVSIPPLPPEPGAPHRPREGEWVEVAFSGDDGCVDAWWEGQVAYLHALSL
jgi:hypothetical protein